MNILATFSNIIMPHVNNIAPHGSFRSITHTMLLAIFFYIAIIISYKIMGKREISELSIFDFVMNLIIADVVATGIVEEQFWKDSFFALVVLVCLQLLMAKIQMKNPRMRRYMNGEGSLIIKNGTIIWDELRKLRIQLDELMMLLRQQNLLHIEDIQYAIMEANGRLSIFETKNATKTFPLPFVISGALKLCAIENAGVTKEWFCKELEINGIVLDRTIKYLFYDREYFIIYTKQGITKHRISNL